jgi:CheY-like chemotaxis protein
LQTVRSSGEALLLLLNDILDLSKIEAGKMELEEIDFDLREVVRDTIRTFAVRAEQKGLALNSELAEDVPRNVRGDPTKLRQVLMNLVGNAIKFTEQGEIEVTVDQQWQSDDEIALHFAVRDTGLGIPKEKLDEVFQPFRQSDTSTTRKFGGSGLGLTISSEMVRMMRGHIWVDSTPGRGSTFHFTVQLRHGAPLALPPVETPSAEVKSSTHERDSQDDWKSAPRVRPLRVLVADDHLANRQLVTSVLRSRGHHCAEATNGEEAIAACEANPFDVVLMDVQMPVLDGFQATAAIRRREESTRTHLPIVALTAHAMAGDREKCLAAGMDSYLAKPIRPRQLVEMVESVADLKPMATETHRDTAESSEQRLPFDLAYALESLDNDRELLASQMEFFLRDSPLLLTDMANAIERRDARQLQLSAHRLKGMLARYAFDDAVALALRLEQQGKAEQLDDATAQLDQLRPLVAQLAAAIKEQKGAS